MINVMYLILLAMLALNVSAEVLKAFFLMEKSMMSSGENIEKRNFELMSSFHVLMQTQPELTREYYAKAQKVTSISKVFVHDVEHLKSFLVEMAGGRETTTDGTMTQVKNKENVSLHAEYLIRKKKGEELRLKVESTRKAMLAVLSGQDRAKVISDLVAKPEGNQSWESFHFEYAPLSAVVAILTKLQNDCRNTEYEVLNKLYGSVSNNKLPVDRVEAVIVPKSKYLLKGEEFEADVFLAAYSSRMPNEVLINGETFQSDMGRVTIRQKGNVSGNKLVKGEILVREADSLRRYPFETKYEVFDVGASVSADNMRLMYRDLENPITVSVPGVSPDRVKIKLSSGELSFIRGTQYTVKPDAVNELKVTVEVKDEFGNWRSFGVENFKVRPMPDPNLQLGVLDGTKKVSVAQLRAQSKLFATRGASFFFNGVSTEVNGFKMVAMNGKEQLGPFTSSGNHLSPAMQQAINQLKSGAQVSFYDVKINQTPVNINADRDFSLLILVK